MKQERPILIQAAMEVECSDLLKKIDDLKELEINNYKYYEGKISNYPIVVSLSKVGLIHASASLTLAIQKYNPRAIINIGITGSASKNLHIGDIVIGETCININSYRTEAREEGTGTNSNNWELLTFLSGETDRLIKEHGTIELIQLAKELNTNQKVYSGTLGSGDCWNREIDRIIYLNEEYGILCEDMESIATYTISNQMNIPVIALKIISDNSLTKEEYDTSVGYEIQGYAYEYIKLLIEKNN